MTIRTELLAQAKTVRDVLTDVLSFLGSPALWSCEPRERELLLEQAAILNRLEAIYLARAELHVEALPQPTQAQAEQQDARERTYRASGLCPVCAGAGSIGSLQGRAVYERDPDAFSSAGTCRRCNGSGRYVRA